MVRFEQLALSLALLGGKAVSASSSYTTNYTTDLLSSGHVKLGDWQTAFEKARVFANSLSTSQKISVITGEGAGNFSALTFKDGSMSVREYYWVTTWPAALAMAMTWDKDAVQNQSNSLASEMKAKGINIANAPMSEPLGRCPYGGRNGETYGPDSYLNGIMFGRATKGISDAGIIPGGKHFLLNEQETNRKGTASSGRNGAGDLAQAYSAVADDKTTHETYLWPFYDAIKNGLGGVMCAMNQVNGSYSCENQDILAGFLKTEMGFPGLVYYDVSAQRTGIHSANAGLDYGQSSYWNNSTIQAGLNNGSLSMDRLNDMVIRNLIGFYKLGQDDTSFPSLSEAGDYVDSRKDHQEIARKYAGESIVLLKNKENALPLKSPKKMAIFGAHAGSAQFGPNTGMDVSGSEATFPGHMAQIGGSGQGSFVYLVTPEYALTTKAFQNGMMLRTMLNDSVISSSSYGTDGIGDSSYSDSTAASPTTLNYAYNQDVCIVFINAYSGEGADRTLLYNEEQDNLVNEVASNCNNTVVVVTTTGPRLLERWIENDNVTAVLYTGALGQESGHAMIDVLYGDVNPSGRLVHTIAKNETDYGVEISEESVIEFTEGNYLDWKYFDKYNTTPRYEFGYGLSYTTFSYSDEVSTTIKNYTALQSTYAQGEHAVGGKEDLWDIVATVSTSVTNSGDIDGAEVVQLYMSYPAAANEPARVLRGFEKVKVASGESAQISFDLRRRDLSYWDVSAQDWAIEKGTYTFHVGASSRDLRSSTSITI